MNPDLEHVRWMRAALALSVRARLWARPNPGVAAIIVRDGRVLGRGVTGPGGRPHAEAAALAAAGGDLAGATLYVTLEPCAHLSARGPACADLVAASEISSIVIGCSDPDPRTAGRGIARLKAAGKAVVVGVEEQAATASLAGFLSVQQRGRPFVTLKLATSLDGRIARGNGESQWITGAAARAHGHLERAQHHAILVGAGTLRADAPRLDVRLPGLEAYSPERLVLSSGDAPGGWQRVAAPQDVYGLQGIHSVLVEGGAMTASAFLAADLVDRLLLYRAPVLLGPGKAALGDIGLTQLADAHGRWRLADSRMLGSDRMEVYQRVR